MQGGMDRTGVDGVLSRRWQRWVQAGGGWTGREGNGLEREGLSLASGHPTKTTRDHRPDGAKANWMNKTVVDGDNGWTLSILEPGERRHRVSTRRRERENESKMRTESRATDEAPNKNDNTRQRVGHFSGYWIQFFFPLTQRKMAIGGVNSESEWAVAMQTELVRCCK